MSRFTTTGAELCCVFRINDVKVALNDMTVQTWDALKTIEYVYDFVLHMEVAQVGFCWSKKKKKTELCHLDCCEKVGCVLHLDV